MEKPVVDFSKLPTEVLEDYDIYMYDSYEAVFDDVFLTDADNEFSIKDAVELLKNDTMQEVVESQPYIYKFGDKYYRWTDTEYMNELAEKYPEALVNQTGQYAPWNEYSLSREECDNFVNKMVSTIRGVGVDEGSGYYGLKGFSFDGKHFNLFCEISKEQEDGNVYYTVYYAVEFDEGDTLFANWAHTDTLDLNELQDVVYEIAVADYSKDIHRRLTIESTPPKEVNDSNILSGDYFVVEKAIKEAYRTEDVELASHFATFKAPDMTIEEVVRLYSDLKNEIDGDKVFEFKDETREVKALWSLDEPFYSKSEIADLFANYVGSENKGHLMAFIEQEVPFRLRELKHIGVTDETIDALIAAVKDDTDVMFDYERFDSFLEVKLQEVLGLDNAKINELKGELSNLRHEINGAAEFAPDLLPMKEKQYALLDIRHDAALNGVEVNLSNDKIIDLEHLDCFWYGGAIGFLEYKGYTVSIEVQGDVRLTVLDEEHREELLIYNNRDNSGAFSNEDVLRVIKDDATLHRLCDEGRIVFSNNNWVEYRIFDENDNEIEIPVYDNVIDNNVLDAFDDVSYYKDLIDEIIQKNAEKSRSADNTEKLFIFDDEIMINDDFEGINGYLWAVDALVDRLPSSEHMENINFYANYNVKTGDLKLISTYDTPVEDGELNKEFEVVLSEDEKTTLVSKLEAYCQKMYSQNCLDFVNSIRREEKIDLIEGERLSLARQISAASGITKDSLDSEDLSSLKNIER